MEDSLEKITINIDTDTATFINKSEFYVDIIDDIKNCIYIKTNKTEIFVKKTFNYKSKYNDVEFPIFNNGKKIYMKLTTGDYDLQRHIVPIKEIIPLTYQNFVLSDEDDINDYYKHDGTYAFNNGLSDAPADSPQVLFKVGGGMNNRTFLNNYPTNFHIKDVQNTVNKYYDVIEVDKGDIISYGNDDYVIYSRDLSGTSCGPNDTNTYKLNPILPELRRFNLQFFYKNEDGKHIPLDITNDQTYTNIEGIFKINVSFTVYYNRKKITRA